MRTSIDRPSGQPFTAHHKGSREDTNAHVRGAIRTPIGHYGGSLSQVRTDDPAAVPVAALMARNPQVDWANVDDVLYGDANQAGESNRNVACMAALLAGLSPDVPGTTINRLCASGMDAVGMGTRSIRSGDQDMVIAGGGVESMCGEDQDARSARWI